MGGIGGGGWVALVVSAVVVGGWGQLGVVVVVGGWGQLGVVVVVGDSGGIW